jgi:hypothetical protein
VRRNWDGVVVVGAGASGILLARELEAAGCPTLLIDEHGLAAGQTGFAHGYLHRGFVFPELEASQSQAFAEACEMWLGAVDDTSHAYVSSSSVLGFPDQASASAARSSWGALGMEVTDDSGPLSRTLDRTFRSSERAVIPSVALQCATATTSLRTMHGHVVSVLSKRDGVTASGVKVVTTKGELTIHANAVVLANGLGMPDLLPLGTGELGLSRARQSYMLVVSSDADLPDSFAMPSRETQGLFSVSRPTEGGRCFLISDFVSFDGNDETGLSRFLWLAGISRVLSRYLPQLWEDPGAEWGVYAAPKNELERSWALGPPTMSILETRLTNALAMIPGKMTLAPLLARRVANVLLGRMQPSRAGTDLDLASFPALDWAEGTWSATPRFSKRELFGDLPISWPESLAPLGTH